MLDIYGNIISVGDTVRTVQPSGGVLPPAAPVVGSVVASVPWDPSSGLAISHSDPPRYILLAGKLNEIVLT